MNKPPAPRTANESGLVREIPEPDAYMVRLLGELTRVSPELMVFPKTMSIYQDATRSTSVRDFHKCKRLYMFKWRMGLIQLFKYAAALNRGHWFHRAVELLLLNDQPQAVDLLDLEYDDWLEKKIMPKIKDGVLPDGSDPDKFCVNALVDFYKAKAMALHFHGQWGVLPAGFTPLAVEKVIYAKVKGIGRPIFGRLDLLAIEDATDYLWIHDHKTTSKNPQDLTGALQFDLQPQHYRLLAMAAFPDKHVAGVIHNIVKTPGIKYCPKTKDAPLGGINPNDPLDGLHSPTRYYSRVKKWYDDAEATAKFDPAKRPSLRSRIRFTDDMPPSDFMVQLAEVARRSHGGLILDEYPRCCDNFTCTGGASGYACEFLPVCRHENPREWLQYMGTRFGYRNIDTGTDPGEQT